MNEIDFPIERINKFFSNHIFEVYLQPTHDGDHRIPTNVKVKLTGVKDYISMGDEKSFVQYTIYILPTNKESDVWNGMWGSIFGRKKDIDTSSNEYPELRWVVSNKLENFLRYFGVDKGAMCTEVVNELAPMKINESILNEGKFDGITRKIIKDIIYLFRYQKEGEFNLPEDASDGDFYRYPGLDDFGLEVIFFPSEDIETFDVECSFYQDEDIIEVGIEYNPSLGDKILYDLIGELNEQLRHELEHVKQKNKGYKFPSKEPKQPEKYYTQPHEIEAQIAGFKRKSKIDGVDFETTVREWFKNNGHKHKLDLSQSERVIQKLLQNYE